MKKDFIDGLINIFSTPNEVIELPNVESFAQAEVTDNGFDIHFKFPDGNEIVVVYGSVLTSLGNDLSFILSDGSTHQLSTLTRSNVEEVEITDKPTQHSAANLSASSFAPATQLGQKQPIEEELKKQKTLAEEEAKIQSLEVEEIIVRSGESQLIQTGLGRHYQLLLQESGQEPVDTFYLIAKKADDNLIVLLKNNTIVTFDNYFNLCVDFECVVSLPGDDGLHIISSQIKPLLLLAEGSSIVYFYGEQDEAAIVTDVSKSASLEEVAAVVVPETAENYAWAVIIGAGFVRSITDNDNATITDNDNAAGTIGAALSATSGAEGGRKAALTLPTP